MARLHFLKHLTCSQCAYSPTVTTTITTTLFRRSSLRFYSNHHKVRYYRWSSHIPFKIHAAASNAKFSIASSSATLPENSLISPSPSPYLSVLIHCPKDNADMLSEALLCFGASSVSIDQEDVRQTTHEICMISMFPEGEDINLSIRLASDSIGLKEIPRYNVVANEEKDWLKRAQESFHPVEVTKGLWVVPMWSTPPDVQAKNIILNPGLAFGTGEHATTKLCLLLLHSCITGGEYILDYGTGTGILAIAALKFGAAFAVGVDIDSEAIASAYQNAALNNIGPEKMQLQLLATENSLSSERENTCEIQTVTGQVKFDVVIANILLNPLLDIADQIIFCAKPGAVVGLSGILSEQVQYIMKRYSPFLEDISVSKMDGWACVSGRKSRNLDVCK